MNIETSFTLVPSDKITLNILDLTNTAKELFFVSGKDLTVGEYYSVIGHNGYYHYLNEVIFTESYENNIIYYVQKYNDRLFKVVDKYNCAYDDYITYLDFVTHINFDTDSVISYCVLVRDGGLMNAPNTYDLLKKINDINIISYLYTNDKITFSYFFGLFTTILKNSKVKYRDLHNCITDYSFTVEDTKLLIETFFSTYSLTVEESIYASHGLYEHSSKDAAICHEVYPQLLKYLSIPELIDFRNSSLGIRPLLLSYIIKEFSKRAYTIDDVYEMSKSIPNISDYLTLTFTDKVKLTFLRIFK